MIIEDPKCRSLENDFDEGSHIYRSHRVRKEMKKREVERYHKRKSTTQGTLVRTLSHPTRKEI